MEEVYIALVMNFRYLLKFKLQKKEKSLFFYISKDINQKIASVANSQMNKNEKRTNSCNNKITNIQ